MTEMCELMFYKVNTLFFNNKYSLLHVDNNRNLFFINTILLTQHIDILFQ